MRASDARNDMSLGIADNLSKYVFLPGEPITLSADLDFGDIQADVQVNGELRQSVRGRDLMDNHLHAIAWLANARHRFDRSLLAA
ncbi:MAG: hypothetical protein JSW48_11025 [Betaproteobacteria bacterium]|nr:MAG: hypothetical protein JSW48_11025 [Betaproteobacteria bacterium]